MNCKVIIDIATGSWTFVDERGQTSLLSSDDVVVLHLIQSVCSDVIKQIENYIL